MQNRFRALFGLPSALPKPVTGIEAARWHMREPGNAFLLADNQAGTKDLDYKPVGSL